MPICCPGCTKYAASSSELAKESIRVSSRLTVPDDFLNEVLAAVVSTQGKPWLVQQLLETRAMESPSIDGLADGVPFRGTMASRMRKVMKGPTVASHLAGMQRTFYAAVDEHTDIMIGMTFKIAASTMGQLCDAAALGTALGQDGA